MVHALEQLHAALHRSIWFTRLTWATRILLATAFIPTGVVKLLGRPFTLLGSETPVGSFFAALHQTGLYWQFLGWMQVVAGGLILIPATSALGAFLFLGIALNIFVITLSMDFGGTPIVTGLMLAAVLFLVFWEFHRWRTLVFASGVTAPPVPVPPRWIRLERLLFFAGASGGMAFFLGTRSFVQFTVARAGLGLAGLAAVALVTLWIAQAVAARRADESD
jgi:hypothetical protein